MGKQSQRKPEEISGRDELASQLADSLNKKFKDFKAVYLLGSQEDAPTEISDWVSTGSTPLDLAIANRPDGGWPVGRIVELQGMEGAGKSLLVAHALRNTQRKGGLAVYIDTENALSEEFLEAIGLDLKTMLYLPMDTIEDSFDAVETMIEQIRKGSKDRLVTIAIDSISAATTKQEQEADYDKDGWSTAKAIVMSKAMRKITSIVGRHKVLLICTSQLREKMGVMFGEKLTTSGGKALGFHASVRVRLKVIEKLVVNKGKKTEKVIGTRVEASVFKNRCGPPHKKALFDVHFDSGVDDYGSWFQTLQNHEVIEKEGLAKYKIVDKTTGEIFIFTSADWRQKLADNQALRDYCYKCLCDIYISEYKGSTSIDLAELEEGDDD